MTEINQDASATTHNQLSRLRQNLSDHFSDEKAHFGIGNDGWGYYFTRM